MGYDLKGLCIVFFIVVHAAGFFIPFAAFRQISENQGQPDGNQEYGPQVAKADSGDKPLNQE